jgi:hypothetical protein
LGSTAPGIEVVEIAPVFLEAVRRRQRVGVVAQVLLLLLLRGCRHARRHTKNGECKQRTSGMPGIGVFLQGGAMVCVVAEIEQELCDRRSAGPQIGRAARQLRRNHAGTHRIHPGKERVAPGGAARRFLLIPIDREAPSYQPLDLSLWQLAMR